MAVIIGAPAPRATITDLSPTDATTPLQLRGAFGVTPVVVGSETYVYVAAIEDGGISVLKLGPDGSLYNSFNVDDGSSGLLLELYGATRSTSVTLGDSQYLYVVGSRDDGLSAFRIEPNGSLTSIQNIDDMSDELNLQLNGASGRLGFATVGGASFLIVSGDDDNGLTVFRANADGTLTYVSNVSDDHTSLNLDDAHDVATATVGGRTFVSVVGGSDNGLSVFELHADGTLENTFNVVDDATLELKDPWGLATAAIGGTQYLIASGRADDGLSVFALTDAGTLTNVFNMQDDSARGLGGVIGLTTFVLEGETFVAASGSDDSAVTVFHMGPGGVLTDVSTIFDTAALSIGYSVENAFAAVDGRPLLIVSGLAEDGVTTFEIGGGDDNLTGTAGSDLILGFAGDDVLDGAGGGDRLIGGSGDDTYVLRSTDDWLVEQTDAGSDTVEVTLATYVLGSQLENLVLAGSAVEGIGNALDNRITGNASANRLHGAEGNDLLSGGRGDDVQFGELGRDRLQGGNGNDRLIGGGGGDDLIGGRGRDILIGGKGADAFIFTLVADTGGSEAKRDHVEKFENADVINLRAIDADRTERGNQAFHLQEDGPFLAGDIEWRDTKAGVVLTMNLDSDDKAEMSILLTDFHGDLHRSDFLL